MLEKFDRLKKKYGDHSSYELLNIMLENELRSPIAQTKKSLASTTKKSTSNKMRKISAKATENSALWKANEASRSTAKLGKRKTAIVKGRHGHHANRYIPKAVKKEVYTGKCANCSARFYAGIVISGRKSGLSR